MPPADVLSSSHGRLRWSTQLLPSADSGQSMAPPATSPLVDAIDKVSFFTHGGLTHVEVRRWANESEFETHTDAGTRRGVVRFVDQTGGSSRVAVGLAIDVDAVAVDVRISGRLLSARNLAPQHLRGLRVDRFRDRILGSGAVGLLGQFNTERLADAALRVLVARALDAGADLESAYRDLRVEGGLATAIADEARGYADHSGMTSSGMADLHAAIEHGAVLDFLGEAIPSLWEAIDESWDDWGAERLATTVGAVIHASLQELCPEYDADEVVVDLEERRDSGSLRVWLSEQTIGGGGLIQEALRRIGDSPRTFFDLVAAAAEPSVDEMVDQELCRVAQLAATDAAVADAIAAVRGAVDHLDRTARFENLLGVLRTAGVFVCHPVISAMSVRSLRPGSDERIDRAIVSLLKDWDELEATIGVDIDLRTYAALRARDPRFDQTTGLSAPVEDPAAGEPARSLVCCGSGAGRCALRRSVRQIHSLTLPRPDPLLCGRAFASGIRPSTSEMSMSRCSQTVSSRGTERLISEQGLMTLGYSGRRCSPRAAPRSRQARYCTIRGLPEYAGMRKDCGSDSFWTSWANDKSPDLQGPGQGGA